MKTIKTTVLLLLISQQIFAQKANRSNEIKIDEKEVTRVIKTLASDEMRGRSAMSLLDISKATDFIDNEFKAIGLKPLQGLTGFRQEFQMDKVSVTSLDVMIDSVKIFPKNMLYVSDNEQVVFGTGVPVKYIKKEDNFHQLFKIFTHDSLTKIVLVTSEKEKEFREMQGYLAHSRILDRDEAKLENTLFVLGKDSIKTFSVNAKQRRFPIRMTNVVGVLEGKSKKNEMVIFSGHYDHIGTLPAIAGDSIANGADDDASGTTAVIELARYFKKFNNNNRTLVFVAFTAEEIGGFGSKYFSKQVNADEVSAMFNIEMIGKPSKWGKNSAFITGFERSDFGTILQKNLKGTPFEFYPDPYTQENLFYRSDNATLARLGVPAHSISTDQIDGDKRYHSVDDEVESLDMSNITATIQAIALSAKTIVLGTDTPTRINKTTVNK